MSRYPERAMTRWPLRAARGLSVGHGGAVTVSCVKCLAKGAKGGREGPVRDLAEVELGPQPEVGT